MIRMFKQIFGLFFVFMYVLRGHSWDQALDQRICFTQVASDGELFA
jgi:hypothetical protein